jgi:transcriptional regulator GlxA family with amidase domain
MQIAIPVFDRMTALDAIGPYEVLSRIPGAKVTFVASETGPKRADTDMLSVNADATLADIPDPDVILIGGGYGSRALMKDQEMLDWVRTAHETSQWTTSVCTGALVLAAAGILDGLEATTYWLELETLRQFGATPVSKRFVEQGKVITAAGVSAGIDMALVLAARLTNDDVAKAIQLGIEYDPQPPFDTGSPAKAPEQIQELVRMAQRAEEQTMTASG